MGRNLPPMDPIDRRNAPWNQPDPNEKYFPAECGECEFVASDVEEMDKHEHPNDTFYRL